MQIKLDDKIRCIKNESRRCGSQVNRLNMKMVVYSFNSLQITKTLDTFDNVHKFVYLGSVISNSGRREAKLKCRIRMAIKYNR